MTRSAFSFPDHGKIRLPGHRVQIHHAAAVADRRVEILLGDLIELELRGDVFEEAFLPRSQQPERLVAHLFGGRDHVVGELVDFATGHVVFLDRLFHVDQRLAFRLRQLDLGLRHVQDGALDASLVAVEDRQGNRHAQCVRDCAFHPVRRIVLVGIGLEQQVRVRVATGAGQPDIGLGALDAQPVGDDIGAGFQGDLAELIDRWWRRERVVDRSAELELVDLLSSEVHERAQVELGLAVGRFCVGDSELGGAKLDLDPVQISQRSVAPLVQLLISGVEVFQPLHTDPRVPDHLSCGQCAEHVSVVDIVDPLPDRLLVLGLQDLLGADGDSSPGLPLVGDVEQEGDICIVLRRSAWDGPAEMVTRIGEKLPVLVEDRVRSEAGLEGVGLGLGDLVELGAEVAAALERDVDGLVEGQSVRRAVVLGTARQLERADKRSRRRRERLRLRPRDRHLKSGRGRCRCRVDDRGGNALGGRYSGSTTEIATGTRQVAEATAPRARGVSHDGRRPADLGQRRAWYLDLELGPGRRRQRPKRPAQ